MRHLTKAQGDRRFGIFCTVPGLIAVCALIVYPLFFNVGVSFFKYNNITPTEFNGLANYQWLLTNRFSDFYLSWKVSFIYSVSSATLTLVLGYCLALLLYKLPASNRGAFRTASILPWAAPLVISAFMWKWILARDIGILNYILTQLGLVSENLPWLSDPILAVLSGIFATVWRRTPFAMLLLLAGLESIGTHLYEAAEVDGASGWQKFRFITLPLNRHQLVIAFVIVWMFTFRTPDVYFALTAGGPGKATYHAGVFLMDLIYQFLQFGRAGALGVFLFLTIALIASPILYYGIIKPGKK